MKRLVWKCHECGAEVARVDQRVKGVCFCETCAPKVLVAVEVAKIAAESGQKNTAGNLTDDGDVLARMFGIDTNGDRR